MTRAYEIRVKANGKVDADGNQIYADSPYSDVTPIDADATLTPPLTLTEEEVVTVGSVLTATFANSDNLTEDQTVKYAWTADGESVGTDAATYTVDQTDIGKTITCVVTVTESVSGKYFGTLSASVTVAGLAAPTGVSATSDGATITATWSAVDFADDADCWAQ